MILTNSWPRAWANLATEAPGHGLPGHKLLRDALIARYDEPQRHYHTLQHLAECLALFGTLQALPEHPGEVEIALWFHDAIYDLGAADNELRSADWARAALLQAGVAAEAAARVHALIMATCHTASPAGPDEQILVDIDLAILGAEPARFAEYEQQIRAEYAFVPEALFRTKRRAILQGFLDRPRIYCTPQCHALFEHQARVNLQAAIAANAAPAH